MKGLGRAMALLVVTLLGATALTKALYAWPELLPHPLRRLGNAIVDASGSTSIETSSDVELAYVFTLCALVTLLLILVVRAVGSRWIKRP